MIVYFYVSACVWGLYVCLCLCLCITTTDSGGGLGGLLAAAVVPAQDITARCETQEYGRWKPNARRHRKGRCSDDDITEFTAQFAPACCGPLPAPPPCAAHSHWAGGVSG